MMLAKLCRCIHCGASSFFLLYLTTVRSCFACIGISFLRNRILILEILTSRLMNNHSTLIHTQGNSVWKFLELNESVEEEY